MFLHKTECSLKLLLLFLYFLLSHTIECKFSEGRAFVRLVHDCIPRDWDESGAHSAMLAAAAASTRSVAVGD